MTDTPLKALLEHATAFSSRDNQQFAQNLAFPFIHVWPDGEILAYEEASDVDLLAQYARARIDVSKFGRTELDEATVVLDWPDLKAFHTKFTRLTPESEVLGQAEAIWVVVRDGAVWKLKLRIGALPVKG